MLHTENTMEETADILQHLLKLFSILKIRIWYNEIIVHKQVPVSVGILCINCGKVIDFLLENILIEKLITHFLINIVF